MAAETRNRPKPSNRSRSSWVVPAAVVTVTAVLIAMVVWVNWSGASPEDGAVPAGQGAPTEVQNPEQPDLTEVEARDEDDLLAAGRVDAPVALIVFSDYQCPFCARWSDQTLPSMMEHVEAGDLRIEWRDINVFGPASDRAARASYAAAVQGAFWEYHDALFENGERRSERELSEEALIVLAGELGLDIEQFATDLAAEETAQVIATNQQLGFDLGATSTPVFILGGQPIVGAQPTEVFENAFQAALDAAQ